MAAVPSRSQKDNQAPPSGVEELPAEPAEPTGVTVSEALRIARRVFGEVSQADKRRLGGALAATIVGSSIAGIFPLLVGWLVSHELGKGHLATSAIIYTLLVVTGLVVGRQIMEVIRRRLVENVATGLERDIRVKTYSHLLRSDIDITR